MRAKYGLRFAALGYLAILLVAPVGFVFYRTFEHGIAAAWHSVTTPEAQHAFWLTIELVAIAVPLNTVFGIVMALPPLRSKGAGRGRGPSGAGGGSSTRSSPCRSRSRRSWSGSR